MISFSYVIFYVADIAVALTFYSQAFSLEPRFVHESGAYAELDTGQTALAFASEELGDMNLPDGYRRNDPNHPPAGAEIVFTTPDVQATYDHAISCGATPTAPPTEKPWGQTVAYIRDPNGLLIEIATPIN